MKKTVNYIALVAALMAGVSFTNSCNKENVADEQPTVQTIQVELGAQFDEATKATYSYTGTGTAAITLDATDKLYVELTSDGSWTASPALLDCDGTKFTGTITITAGSYIGTDIFKDASSFSATLYPGGETPVNFAGGTKATAVPKVAGVVKTGYDSATKTITLAAQNAILFYTVGYLGGTSYNVYVTDGTYYRNGSVTRNNAGEANNASFAVGFPAGSTHEIVCNFQGKTPIIVTPASATTVKVYNISRTSLATLPTGAIHGVFSVSASKKIYFSQGNLLYDNGNFKFYATQKSRKYTTAGDCTSDYVASGSFDLFGWATSGKEGENAGTSPSYQAQPAYTTTATATIYGPNITDGNSWSVGSNWDWGSNSITVQYGSAVTGTWRTLTKDEWFYLLGMETNNTDKDGHQRYQKYGLGKVDNRQGLIILPDTFGDPCVNGGTNAFVKGVKDTFDSNIFTDEQWAIMERAGCVFLPAACRRNGTTISADGGYYWSSTSADTDKAWNVQFSTSGVNPAQSTMRDRYRGNAVRLVQDVE